MRIISGKFKGKLISFVKSKSTRPLKDSVKENIFNIITHSNLIDVDLEKSTILDLYSGIGSFGLECLSRGARETVFVERDKNITKTLYKNLLALSIKNEATIINEDIIIFLKKKNIIKKFDILFLDPPFASNNFLEDLKLIKQEKIYKTNHLVVIHREKKSFDNFEDILNPIVIREYGRSKIIFAKFLT